MAVFRRVRDGHFAFERVDDADLARKAHRLVEVQRFRVRDHEVMLDLDGLRHLECLVRREVARDVAVLRNRPRLIECRPALDAVAERLKADFRVIDEMRDDRAVQPAALMEIAERRVEMVQRHERFDAMREAGVDELVVVVDAFLVDLALALRQDARPRNRDADAVDAEFLAEREIFGIFMIEIARGVGREAAARTFHILIPRAGAAAVLRRRALDLIGRRRAAEDEVVGKLVRGLCHLISLLSS